MNSPNKFSVGLYIFLLSFFTLNVSCSRTERSLVDNNSFPVIGTTLKLVGFDDQIMYPSNLILLNDSLLIVYEPKNITGFLKVFDTSSDRKISEFAAIGESPEEFTNPRILNDLSFCDSFYVGDAKRIVRYTCDSISNAAFQEKTVLDVPQEMMSYNNVLSLSDSLIVYTQTGEHPLSLYRPQTETLTFTDYYPDTNWSGGSLFIRNMEVFANSMTSDGINIAIAYHNWDIISLLTPTGEIIKNLYFNDWDFNKGKMKIGSATGNLDFNPDCRIFFTKIRSNRKYVFALGWSDTKEHIKKGEATSYIYILDWKGNIIRKLTFDRSVSTFCIHNDKVPFVIAMGDDGELHVFECQAKLSDTNDHQLK